jgi:ribonucleoside-diphosphate reductase alpha chain
MENIAEGHELNSKTGLPDFFVSSEEIDWEKRVEIQAAITKWLDHSCSSTINLPKGTTSETVSKIYMKAWKSGCKGMTVYVDGSRSGVLITKEEKNEKKKKADGLFAAIERPNKIPCDVYQITADGDKWTVMVGLVNDRPYEIFCGKKKNVDLGKTEKGYIEKEGKGVYSLHIGEDTILKDISLMFNDIQGAITRLISTSLRHGVDIQFVVQQLEKSDGNITSFNKAISRVLKKYIKDGTKEHGAKCPSCSQESIIREEGCVKCSSCGWTKC